MGIGFGINSTLSGAIAGQAGNFELNVMLPVIAYNLLQSISTLASVTQAFNEKCISGITANREICAAYIEKSLALVTALVPGIGYDKGAEIAKKAYATGKTIREVALAEKILPEEQLDKLLN